MKKKEISRRELREMLRKAPSQIPGAPGKFYGWRERVEMEKKIFGKKYGTHISEREFEKRMRELGKEKFRARTGAEKMEIDRLMRYIKQFRGK